MSIQDPIITFEPIPYKLDKWSGDLPEMEERSKKMNVLQVTMGNRAIAFDLTDESQKLILAISDFPAVQDFMDPETHIESSFVMTQATREETESSKYMSAVDAAS